MFLFCFCTLLFLTAISKNLHSFLMAIIIICISLDISIYSRRRMMMIKTKAPQYPQRVRNELRFRELTVLRVERVGAPSSASCWAERRWKVLSPRVLTTIPSSFSASRRCVYAAAGDGRGH
jgi:hypothetical protein